MDLDQPANHPLPPGLYIVSTPIGNLRDITLRALDTLKAVDIVACEDTRITGKLLSAYSIKKQMIPCHDHNEGELTNRIMAEIISGKSIALTSDAGTPLISDPGYKIVRDCLEHGIKVIPIPGANAVLPALQLSGLPTDRFFFLGFTPAKQQARQDFFRQLITMTSTMVFYETGPRIAESLRDMADIFGSRPGAVVREITKMFEESRRGTLAEIAAFYAENQPKGEIVVIVGGAEEHDILDEISLRNKVREALKSMSVKDSAAFVAQATGLPKKQIYDLALDESKNKS